MSTDPSAAIFHHPGPIDGEARTGSQVRPRRLLDAFGSLGWEVEAVVGSGEQRLSRIKRLLKDIKGGRRFAFVYAEARSIPTLLAEADHWPRYPVLDFAFFRKIRRHDMPVGLFYRDVFWRFQAYRRMLALPGRLITVPLYWYDWWWYGYVVDHLFLPSLGMARYLPSPWPKERLSALPPGAALIDLGEKVIQNNCSDRLKLFYVGGVKPFNYDLSPLFQVVRQTPELQLTLCCRENEWLAERDYYARWLNERIKIIHATSAELGRYYAEADVFGLLWQPNTYLDFAVSVKLFESMSYGLPIITLSGTEAARIVENERIGWIVDDVGQAINQLLTLHQDRARLFKVRQQVLNVRERHTWKRRAQQVIEIMTNATPIRRQ